MKFTTVSQTLLIFDVVNFQCYKRKYARTIDLHGLGLVQSTAILLCYDMFMMLHVTCLQYYMFTVLRVYNITGYLHVQN